MTFIPSKRVKTKTVSGLNENLSGDGSFLRLLRLMLPYKYRILFAALCVLMVNMAVIVKPFILKLVIDDFFVGHVAQKGFYTITTMGILYLLTALAGSGFSYLQKNIINRVGQDIIRGLRSRLFKTIQYLPLRYLDRTSSGRLITRATNDVEALSQLYTDVLLNLFQDIFLLIGIAYTMFALNFKLALLSFTVIPPMAAALFLLRKRIKRNFLRVKTLIGRINGFM
ncbi:MAG TPA: ABC transporter transmembrane domain-containing protein, partial [Clostridia bacterium]|nr:ABC transporter transmembrane domain-containing protein [Clostridia bacterium]